MNKPTKSRRESGGSATGGVRAIRLEPGTLYHVACVYSLLGKLDQAIDMLERSSLNKVRAWKGWFKRGNVGVGR